MVGIDQTQRLLAQIRAAIARTDSSRRKSRASEAAHAEAAVPSDHEGLFSDLKVALRSVHLDTDEGLNQGRRAFFQVVLLDEFGLSLASDPRFALLVEKVHDAVVQQDALRIELDRLLREISGR